MSLRELAQEKLDDLQRLGRLQNPPTISWIWLLSALRSIVAGRLVEPEVDTLKQFTARASIWKGLSPAFPEEIGAEIRAIVASHRLAIVKRDDAWLTELFATWDACPELYRHLLRLSVQGEIGLGLAPGGPRPFGWSAEELAELEERGHLSGDDPADLAWRALAERDWEAARRALVAHERVLAALPQQWEAAPSEGLDQILSFPDVLFQVQRRALAALLDRAQT